MLRPGHSPTARPPWSVPIALSEVPQDGRHVDLVADARVRAAIARLAGLAALSRLSASFDVSRHGRDGLRVIGRVHAMVVQTCVVTLEPIKNEVDEPVDLVFSPSSRPMPDGRDAGEIELEIELLPEEAPEPLVGGVIDLGAIATEFLILGIDPYPRKPGAVFEGPAAEEDENARPFAALAALKRRQSKE